MKDKNQPQINSTVLVLNTGSSSLKFAVFNMHSHELELEGIAERLFQKDAQLVIKYIKGDEAEKTSFAIANANHTEAITELIKELGQDFKPVAVGHRVVHGGELFREAVRIDADVKAQIAKCSVLAPLHNPANLEGIDAAESSFKNIPQFAVFDTAFHNTLTEVAFLYALPKPLYRDFGIRRYGFHGTSHHYVSLKTAELMQQDPSTINMVVAHLGNGCSATAVAAGKSVDTTMGLTPLEGLVMGTRSGSIDPSIISFLVEHSDLSLKDVDKLLNKESGLLGLSELSNDMRTLESAMENGHEGAALAIEVFCFRLAKAIAGLSVSLSSLDALVFTGGIGENSELVRSKTCAQLKVLGIEIDNALNNSVKDKATKISTANSAAQIWVVATNEELMIAQQAFTLYRQG